MDGFLNLPQEQVRLLLIACDGDAALLYLWESGDKSMPCPLSGARLEQAGVTLARLGLTPGKKAVPQRDERPVYTEEAVSRSLQENRQFGLLVGQVQRTLGRVLSVEELKSLLSVRDYLRMPDDVISILVTYCLQRNRARGVRAPSMRTIEKEAYRWSDEGVDTVEAAVGYMRLQMERQSHGARIAGILQITGRRLTQAEENYVNQWIAWRFPDDVIRLAYEKTCLATGGLKWPYMHSILKSWNEKGLRTLPQIREGDGAGKTSGRNKREISDFEREAARKLLEEGI